MRASARRRRRATRASCRARSASASNMEPTETPEHTEKSVLLRGLRLFSVGTVLGACAVLTGASSRQATRTVYVTVAGEHDAAVPNLSAADFEIKEEGKARSV